MKLFGVIIISGILGYFCLHYICKIKKKLQIAEKESTFIKLSRSVYSLLTKSTENPQKNDLLIKSLQKLLNADAIALFEEVNSVLVPKFLLEVSEVQAKVWLETLWKGMSITPIDEKESMFYCSNLRGKVVHLTISRQRVLLCSFPVKTERVWLKTATMVEKNAMRLLFTEFQLKSQLSEGASDYLALVFAGLLLSCGKGLLVSKEGPGGLKVIGKFGDWDGETLSAGVKKLLLTSMRLAQPLNFGQKGAPVSADLSQWQLTDVLIVPVMTETGVAGALFVANQLTKEYQGRPYSPLVVVFMESLASFIGSKWSQDSIRQAMQERLFKTVQLLVETLEARDRYTRGHSENVARIARSLALNLGIDSEQAEETYLAGILHDIGKIGIPENIINKLGPLSENEWAQIREHPNISRRILEALPEFSAVLDIIEQHHERWDGLGYPRNLRGEEINLCARILAVADSFDAMTSERIYQKARTPEGALIKLRKGAGSQWDPKIVDAFVQWWTEENMLSTISWNLKFTRNIYKDILATATKEKITIVDKEELASPLSIIPWERLLDIKVPENLPVVRKTLEEWLIQEKVNSKKIKDLVLVVSEIGTNTLKHGNGGKVTWGRDNEGNFMILSLDQGNGFNIEKLPQSLLVKGFSTKKSLGLGFSIILEKCKSVTLATDSNGSTILVNCGQLFTGDFEIKNLSKK